MKRKKLIPFLTALLLVGVLTQTWAQSLTLPPSGDNQKSVVTQHIGSLAQVTIAYNSPDVTGPRGEDRTGKIWGEVAHFGFVKQGFGLDQPAPWRAGANENTTITFSHDVLVQGKPVKAGTYGLHMAIQKEGPWTLILSNNSTAWGSYFYEEKDDALRVEVMPEESAHHEWLTYEFVDRRPTYTTVALLWEKKKVPFKIEVANMTELYMANIRKELQSDKGFSWQAWNQAANYALMNNANLDEALQWANTAITAPYIGQENFTTLQTKGMILDKMGRTAEAKEVMAKAINHPSASVLQIHGYGRQLLMTGKKQDALEIFKLNAKRFPKAWPVNVGLARGYSAVGDYTKALKHAKLAANEAPDKLNKDTMMAAVEKLQKKEDIN
jgi:tetratricopeptide (TPR) repeat protein